MGRKRKSLHNSTNGPTTAAQVETESSSPSKRLRAAAARSTMSRQAKPKPTAVMSTTTTLSRRNLSRNRPVLTPAAVEPPKAAKLVKKSTAKKIAPKNIKTHQVSGVRKTKVVKKLASKSSGALKKLKVTGKVKPVKTKSINTKVDPRRKTLAPVVSSVNADKSVKGRKQKAPKALAPAQKVKKPRKGAFTLSPKPLVTEYLVDPTFHTNQPIPFISPMFQGKLLIRAVITQDKGQLARLVQDKKKLYSYCLPRSIAVEKTALHYAILNQDIPAMKLLMNSKEAEKLGPISEWLIQEDSTGRGSHLMFGHGLRNVTVGRGGKEGNAALLKDKDMYGPSCARIQSAFYHSHILEALESGIKMSTLEKIAAIDKNTEPYFWHGWLSSIVYAARAGQNELAGQLVELAIKKGGFGFNLLHQEALVKSSKSQLSPFKSQSVPKKAIGNARITPIHCAAINPDPYCLMTLMSVLPDFNVLDMNNWTPMHYAAVCSGPGPLKYLLSRGMTTNMIDKDGNTPLHAAARCGRVQNVKLILAAESKFLEMETTDSEIPEVTSISKINKAGLMCLHVACKQGHEDVVAVLLGVPGVDGNKSTSAQFEKLTPLMLACQHGHLPVVKRLVEAGMKLQLPDRRGRTALAHAVINGNAEIVSYLLRLGDNHLAKDTSGNTLVHYAAAYGWYFNFKLLMEAGCCPNEPNQWKMTPIAIAFMKGHMGLVELLLKEPGVDVNSPIDDSKGMTLLLQTCSFKAGEEMITRLKFLVETQKADCSIADSENNTAAHYLIESEAKELKIIEEQKARGWEVEARKSNHTYEALKIVTQNGCNLEAKNSKQMTSVALGIQLGCFEMVEQLLKLGGKVTSEPNYSGDTILHLLIEHIAGDAGTKFFKQCTKNSQILLQLKEMAKGFNSNGMSPLLQTLSRHQRLTDPIEVKRVVEFILFLVLQLEADVNAAIKGSEDGKLTDTVLHLAVKTNYSENILNILLSKKPDLEVVNGESRTPLVVAILGRKEASCRILVESGANVNFKSPKDDGKSIIMLEVAQKPNSFSLIPFLVEKGAIVKEVKDPFNENSVLHFVSKSPTSALAVPAIRSLLKGGLSVNTPNKYGRTSLHLAVNSRGGETDASYDVESVLLESGASLTISDIHGRIPLHFAFLKIGKMKKGSEGSFMDPIELVTLLTSAMKETGRKKELDTADEFGQLPIHCAAVRGATISASHLLAETSIRAVVDLPDGNGNSPFGLAVMGGHEGCALMFLQAGANFLNDLNRGTGKTRQLAFGTSWVWKPLKEEVEHQDKSSIVRSKYSILQEIVRRDWQGLLYLMLEKLKASGVGVSPGIEAALRTNRLTLAAKLIDRVKVNKELITKKQSLLHTLAQEAPNTGETKDLQIRILHALIAKNADVNSLDAHQSTPLIYAAIKWNSGLSSELTKLMNIRSIPTLKPDFLARTPFSAIFWEPISWNAKMGDELRAWAENLLYSGAEGNILSQYPITESSSPTVRYIPSDTNTNLFLSSVTVKYSPLIMAVIYGNYEIVKWLLSLKGKIDINFGDSLGRTPLMHAVRLNDIQMVKLLLNPHSYDFQKDKTPFCSSKLKSKPRLTGQLLTNAKDKQGWSVIHHLVSPRSPSTLHYAQAGSILELLESIGTVLDSKSNQNETPLEMSIRLKQHHMAELLAKLQKTKLKMLDEFEPFPKCSYPVERIPIETSQVDSKKMLSKMEEKLSGDPEEPLAIPDSLSDLTPENSMVLVDEGRKVPFDCLLTQVDLNYGIYGLYNFYKMQLIQQTKGPQLLVLFTRWGRVGDSGQYQKTPFPSREEAVKEFKKIFRSKTGNVWDELSTTPFLQQPKKYRLVNLERRKAQFSTIYAEKIQINFEEIEKSAETKESKLPKDILQVVKQLSLEHKSKSSTNINEDSELLPFGLLSRESLEKAEKLLDRLETILVEKDALQTKPDYNKEHYAKLMDSVVGISEEFYTLILVCGFASEKISPLFQMKDLRRKQELVRSLLHYEFASQLLLGAQWKQAELNPLDYIYRSLGTKIESLDEASEESQLILEYIYNTSEKGQRGTIEKIYRVEVPNEEERLGRVGIGNRHLLWHGTSTCNLLSILHRGLQVAPLGYSFNGSLFGKGIYFADMFGKSTKYCTGEGSKFMLLCEVALGNIQKVELESYRNNEFDPLKPGCQSLKTSNSKWKPLPRASVIWKRRTVSLGPKCENILPEDKYHGLDYNEFIVFQPDQVNLRYLVQYRENNSFPEVNMQNIFT